MFATAPDARFAVAFYPVGAEAPRRAGPERERFDLLRGAAGAPVHAIAIARVDARRATGAPASVEGSREADTDAPAVRSSPRADPGGV